MEVSGVVWLVWGWNGVIADRIEIEIVYYVDDEHRFGCMDQE